MKCCDGCQYGKYDPSSDLCDDCTYDPDTGTLGGFTDHSIKKHFDTEEERKEYYENHMNDEDDED